MPGEAAVLAASNSEGAACSSMFGSEDSRRLSMDLDALSASNGFALRADLSLAPASHTTMGAVLGVAVEADELAKGMDANAELSSDSEVRAARS